MPKDREDKVVKDLRGIEHTFDFRSAVASYALIVELLDLLFLSC